MGRIVKHTEDGYRVHETVSDKEEPVTPAFETEDALIDYLASNGDLWDQQRGDPPAPRAAYEQFVKVDKWAAAGVILPEVGLVSGVAACARLAADKG